MPLYLIDNVSLLYLCCLHWSHGTYTSGKKCISIFNTPSPLQVSHLPPFTLKLYLPGLNPLAFEDGSLANNSRISVNAPV